MCPEEFTVPNRAVSGTESLDAEGGDFDFAPGWCSDRNRRHDHEDSCERSAGGGCPYGSGHSADEELEAARPIKLGSREAIDRKLGG